MTYDLEIPKEKKAYLRDMKRVENSLKKRSFDYSFSNLNTMEVSIKWLKVYKH